MNAQQLVGVVSVIIPVYNRIDYIDETISSVLNQTHQNFELIVVDDGSTDGSYEYLEKLANESKISLYSHPNRANRGQSAALNIGLKHAKGEYIAILDSDDLFELDKLQYQVEYLVNNPEKGIVYGDGTGIDATGEFLYDITGKFDTDPSDANEVLLDCYFLLPQNSLVRSTAYNKAGNFNEDYRAAQDHDMLIRLSEVAAIGYIKRKVFKYRRHSGSISNNGQFDRWNNGFRILKSAVSRYPYKGSTVRKRKAVLHFRLALCFYKQNIFKYHKAIFHFICSGLLDPQRALRVVLRIDKSSFSS